MNRISEALEQKFGAGIAKFYRFVFVGGVVTIFSLVLIYVFLKLLETPLVPTYILVYVATIFVSYLLNANYTFKKKRSWQSILMFYGSYVLTLGLGTGALGLLKKYLAYENWILAFMVVPFTMVVNFLLSTFIFGRNDPIGEGNG
ncbi:hypothetical protein MASR1M36_19130 [Candidatus Cloacimonadaceae bacterium]